MEEDLNQRPSDFKSSDLNHRLVPRRRFISSVTGNVVLDGLTAKGGARTTFPVQQAHGYTRTALNVRRDTWEVWGEAVTVV